MKRQDKEAQTKPKPAEIAMQKGCNMWWQIENLTGDLSHSSYFKPYITSTQHAAKKLLGFGGVIARNKGTLLDR